MVKGYMMRMQMSTGQYAKNEIKHENNEKQVSKS